MLLNLNTFKIGGIGLGKKAQLEEGHGTIGFISAYTQEGVVHSFSVRLSEFYSKGELFKGQIQVNDKRLILDENTQPKSIASLFTVEPTHWDDGVEVNYQYRLGSVELEFSWHWLGSKLVANYLSLSVTDTN